MGWIAQVPAVPSIAWILLSTFVALLAGVLSSWLTYRFVRRQEIAYTAHMETEKEKQERIRQEIVRWSNPILGAVNELDGRLWNILENGAYLALSKSYKSHEIRNWSLTYDHWMPSTLFLFGQYFAWVQMLQAHLNFEFFKTKQDHERFFAAIDEVGKSLARWPPNYECSDQDTQVFRLQQRSIGELMTIRNEDGRQQCVSYPDFLRMLDEEIQHFAPLRTLLEDVKPSDDCRWKRLQATKEALDRLQVHCNRLLGVSAQSEESEDVARR
jgi:hypothetical protein